MLKNIIKVLFFGERKVLGKCWRAECYELKNEASLNKRRHYERCEREKTEMCKGALFPEWKETEDVITGILRDVLVQRCSRHLQ